MLRGIFTGGRGMAPMVFFVTVTWALLAVLLLMGTLFAARDISRQVKGAITPELGRIDKNTALIDITAKTARLTGGILTAAKPLSGQFDRVIGAAKNIDATAKVIDRNVKPINTHVRSIAASIAAVGASVGSINHSVHAINSTAHGIDRSASSIDARFRTVDANVGRILSVAASIDAPGIVKAGDGIVAVVKPGILSDFDSVLFNVGNGGAAANGANTVDGHANSIDCSRLLSTGGKDSACGRSR